MPKCFSQVNSCVVVVGFFLFLGWKYLFWFVTLSSNCLLSEKNSEGRDSNPSLLGEKYQWRPQWFCRFLLQIMNIKSSRKTKSSLMDLILVSRLFSFIANRNSSAKVIIPVLIPKIFF